jgi:hypothetical protein
VKQTMCKFSKLNQGRFSRDKWLILLFTWKSWGWMTWWFSSKALFSSVDKIWKCANFASWHFLPNKDKYQTSKCAGPSTFPVFFAAYQQNPPWVLCI